MLTTVYKKTLVTPIVIANGDMVMRVIPIKIESKVCGCKLKEVKAIAEADTLILATHRKGHDLT